MPGVTIVKLERLRVAVPLFAFASGACALIYESLWMRSFGLIFGNTTHAVAAILAVFMGGLALGSSLTSRLVFRRVVRAYALVELGIGACALLTIPLLHFLPLWYGGFVRDYNLSAAAELVLRLVGATLALLPPTILLGMTFPLLIEFLTRAGKNFYKNMGFLYRTNTLGGAFGVVLVTFVLMPLAGKLVTFVLAAATNLAVGLLAWHWGKDFQELPRAKSQSKTVPQSPPADSPRRLPMVFLLTAFATGLFSFGLEILWTRSLALVVGSSIYSFNIMLTALLLGIVAGTAVYETLWPRIKNPARWLGAVILSVGALSLIDVALVGFLPVLSFAMIKALPVSFPLIEGADFLLCFAAMFLVTAPLGFLFPFLTHFMRLALHSPQKISSHLYIWNTLGTIVGSFGTAFLLVPRLGLQTSFVALAALPLALGIWFLGGSIRWQTFAKTGAVAACALACLALARWYRPWNLYTMTAGIYKYGIDWRDSLQSAWDLPEFQRNGRQILYYKEGDEGVVCVNQAPAERTISVNGKSDGGSGQDVITQRLIAHVPLMLHPYPQSALVIGWGTGSTVGSAGLYPSLKRIDCVEIESLMFACRDFFKDINYNIAADPRFRIHIKDGRNYLLTTPARYDVIMSEPSNPWITGVSNLFTKDFYAVAKGRLNKGGIFCQWFHYYNMSLRDLKAQTRTFAESFPYASMWLVPPRPVDMGTPVLFGDILFIGSSSPYHLDYERVRRNYEIAGIRKDLVPLGGVEDELSFLTNYFMSRDDMVRFGSGTPDNTDDFPYLEFSAPRGLYVAQAQAQQSMGDIYQSFDEGGREEFPPIENYPALEQANLSRGAHAELCVQIGTKYLRKAFMARARRLAETAIKEDSQNGGAYALLGEALYDQGLLKEAENLFVQALGVDPRLQKARRLLGVVYYNRKDYAKSEEMFAQLSQYYPNDPMAYYGQALICAERRDWSHARDLVDRTLSIDPGMADAARLRDYLKQMK